MPEERLYEDTTLEVFQRKHAIRILLFMDRAGNLHQLIFVQCHLFVLIAKQ